MLEKTLESPLDCKEIQPVHPKDQSWVITRRTDTEPETPILWSPDVKNWLIWKDLDAGKDWRSEEKEMTEDEMAGWHHRFNGHAAASAKSLQPCLTLWDPIDSSPPGSTVPGILQARTLELAAISFSDAWKWKVNTNPLSRVRLAATPGAAAYQAPPSMEFSRQEYWSGLPLPSPNGHEFE